MTEPALEIDEHFPETPDGWALHLKRTVASGLLRRARRPVVIVPGYGMNAFIFGFHPRGTSMERCFAEAGLEVWSANLRRQGRARRLRKNAPGPSMRRLAEVDLTTAIEAVLSHTHTDADRVDILGCSLGGSVAYGHLALRHDHRIASLVAVGAPLRWTTVPTLLGLAFRSPRLVGMVRLSGVRRIAGLVLPLVDRMPSVISMYMNTTHVDMSAAAEMVNTVEDPDPRVNRDIARWIGARDMVLRGVNVTEAMGRMHLPLLLVLANRDGIVPEAAALSAEKAWANGSVTTLRIGTPEDWYAHADLFVGNDAPRLVFDPIVRWLESQP